MNGFIGRRPVHGLATLLAVVLILTAAAVSSEVQAKGPDTRSDKTLKQRGKSKKWNSPPEISGSPPGSIVQDSFFDFEPVASDAEGDSLTFQVSNKPRWADFDPTTGALYGTPGAGDVGTYDGIRISVSDGISTARLPEFAIDVTSTGSRSVTLNWTPPTQNTDGTPLTDLAGYRIYFGDDPDNMTDVIQIDNSGLTSYVIDNLTPAVWYFHATSLNSEGVESNPSPSISFDLT